MEDIAFEAFVEFYRSNHKTQGSSLGVELAGEAFLIQGLSQNLDATSEVVDEINASLSAHRSSRIKGFTSEEKAHRSTVSFMTNSDMWNEHVR